MKAAQSLTAGEQPDGSKETTQSTIPRNDSPIEKFNQYCGRAWIMASVMERLQILRFAGGFTIDDCLLYLDCTLEQMPTTERGKLLEAMRKQAVWAFRCFPLSVVKGVAS